MAQPLPGRTQVGSLDEGAAGRTPPYGEIEKPLLSNWRGLFYLGMEQLAFNSMPWPAISASPSNALIYRKKWSNRIINHTARLIYEQNSNKYTGQGNQHGECRLKTIVAETHH